MADLPCDRLSTEPPFTYVGVDVFVPWAVITRCTCRGQANTKRWAVLFICTSTHAVHIELIKAMDISSSSMPYIDFLLCTDLLSKSVQTVERTSETPEKNCTYSSLILNSPISGITWLKKVVPGSSEQ